MSDYYWKAWFESHEHETLSVPCWKNIRNFQVNFIANAQPPFPGVDHPAMEVSHPDVDGWVHVVEVNTSKEYGAQEKIGWQLVSGDSPWVYADTNDEARDKGNPLFLRESIFFHNPSWPAPPLEQYPEGVRWEGFLYGVTIQSHRIEAIGGISWGYFHTVAENPPTCLGPDRIEEERWQEHRALLGREYKGWEFI